MFCVLNTSHPDGQGGSWKNLSFYIDNKLVESPQVKRFNETAIRLYVPVSEVSSNGFYGVTCKQNHVTGICVRHVYVGCEFIISFWEVFQIVSTPLINAVIITLLFFRSSPRCDWFSVHLLQLGATRVCMARALQPHRNYLRPFLSGVSAIEVRSITINCLAL
jgi:hypothetical protein